LCFFICQCANASNPLDSTARVQINCKSCTGQEIIANTAEIISNATIQLAASRIDSSGYATIDIPLVDSCLLFITIGQDLTQNQEGLVYDLYLEPKQTLEITIETDGTHFAGALAVVNEYLHESKKVARLVMDQANNLAGRFSKLSSDEKNHFKDTYGTQFNLMHERISKDARIPDRLKTLVISYNEILVQWRKSFIVRMSSEEMKEKSGYDAPHFLEEIPVNPLFLTSRMDLYARLIDGEIESGLHPPIYLALEKDNKAQNTDTLVFLSEKAIQESERAKPIREFLRAKNIAYWLKSVGFTPLVNRLFTDFQKAYPNSSYSSGLRSMFDQYSDLAEGKAAKDFTATDSQGKEFHLSDLKGKVIYLDTWATWCVPCLAEFEHSKAMIEHYRKNEKVVFLFVSVDANIQKWQSFLQNGKAPNGLHINQQNEGQGPSIFELYRMRGIPHYVLIDQSGKIKASNAPRPSSKESYKLIDSLLD